MTTHASYDIVEWQEIESVVSQLNPELASLVSQIKGVNRFKCIKVKYPYGYKIINNGEFSLPLNNEPTDFLNLPDNHPVKKLLNYHWSTIPFGIVSHNAIGTYVKLGNEKIPSSNIRKGKIFSLFSIFEEKSKYFPDAIFEMTSGTQFLYPLPQLNHQESVDRMKRKYGEHNILPIAKPDDFYPMIKQLANSLEFDCKWHSEIILFTKDFFADNKDTIPFKHYLALQLINRTKFQRDQDVFEAIWSRFLHNRGTRHLSEYPLIEYSHYILLTALGETNAYTPLTDNTLAPIVEISNAFVNTYLIRYFRPTIMGLTRFDGSNPVYISIKSTLFMKGAQPSGVMFTTHELKKVKGIITAFIDHILNGADMGSFNGTYIYNQFKRLKLSFYYPHHKRYSEKLDWLDSVSTIPKRDMRFLDKDLPTKPTLQFPKTSNFWDGCVSITM